MPGQVLARFGTPASRDAAFARRERDPAVAPSGSSAPTGSGEAGSRPSVPLTSLPRHATGLVAGVRLPAEAERDPASERMALRLMEIGFVQGARLRVVAFGQPGNDPIGVRVGGRGGMSTFALRRQEAGCVWVWPDAMPGVPG
ncbi:MAG TPA: FeoA family protein [Burkholderiaceae bacterium]